ncbi:MAG: hypothetical protein RLZZ75_1211, partial [Bacteroidota bacterium]
MKKLGTALIIILLVAGTVIAWSIFSSITNFSGAQKSFTVDQSIVKKGAVIDHLSKEGLITNSIGLHLLSL